MDKYSKIIDLFKTIQDNDSQKVVALLVECKEMQEKLPAELLIWPCARGYSTIVKLLLQAGMDVNASERDGQTALIAASQAGHKELVELLLAHGADVNKPGEYRGTALAAAAFCGHAGIVELLLKHGAQVNSMCQNQITPLLCALIKRNKQIIKLLLKAGADSTLGTFAGKNALYYANCLGDEDILTMLKQ
ncbi:MAG: ankyrin repeat domain-containing protein [Candidatus Babeliales bacterium]